MHISLEKSKPNNLGSKPNYECLAADRIFVYINHAFSSSSKFQPSPSFPHIPQPCVQVSTSSVLYPCLLPPGPFSSIYHSSSQVSLLGRYPVKSTGWTWALGKPFKTAFLTYKYFARADYLNRLVVEPWMLPESSSCESRSHGISFWLFLFAIRMDTDGGWDM